MVSSTFNGGCYIDRYPDLQDRSTMPAMPGLPYEEQLGWMYKSSDGSWHYGRTNGRKLKRIQDDPYWHWINFGRKEGRVPGCDLAGVTYSDKFDADAYTKRYPNVNLARFNNPYVGDPLRHYMEVGRKQGRVPGYELVTPNTEQGLATPGTTRIMDIPEVVDIQKKFDEQNKGTGDDVSITDLGEKSEKGSGNLVLLGLAAVAAIFLFKKKGK